MFIMCRIDSILKIQQLEKQLGQERNTQDDGKKMVIWIWYWGVNRNIGEISSSAEFNISKSSFTYFLSI